MLCVCQLNLFIDRKRNAFWHSFTFSEELVLSNFINIFVKENLNECLSLEKMGKILYHRAVLANTYDAIS